MVGSYERARKGRQVGEHEDGFTVTASKTVAVPIERLYAAFVDADQRARWLPDAELRERTTIEPRSARFDWGDGPSRIHVSLTAKGEAKSDRGADPRAAARRRRGGAHEGVLAGARRRAQGGAGVMSAVTRIGTVIVPVADQDAALEFYVGTLGFEVRLDAPFGPACAGSRSRRRARRRRSRSSPATALEVSFATTDAAADHAALLAAGVDADAELIRMGEGVPPMFTFRDPDGNRFRVVERA